MSYFSKLTFKCVNLYFKLLNDYLLQLQDQLQFTLNCSLEFVVRSFVTVGNPDRNPFALKILDQLPRWGRNINVECFVSAITSD